MPASAGGNLTHQDDSRNAWGRRVRSASKVLSLATTAKLPRPFANREWTADLEYIWRVRVAPDVRRLHARARRRRRQARGAMERGELGRRVQLMRSAEWAEHRARALALSRVDSIAACGKRWRRVVCGCGVREVPVDCKQAQLCGRCRRRHWRAWARRITLAIDHALGAARRAWARRRKGPRPGVYLLTLTGPHSGDLEVDRRRLGVDVRRLLKHATLRQWWSTYALTWEATDGRDGHGHMHAHLAVVSAWIPYHELHAVWGVDRHINVQAPRRDADGARSAAEYLAKYVTKGVEPAELTGRKAGELLCAMRGRRKVSTSRHFWRPRVAVCGTCGSRYELAGAPCGLQHVIPGAVLRSLSERLGSWVPRGGPQALLRFDSG